MNSVQSTTSNNAIIVSIEGNIGSGKTTLLSNLQNAFPGKNILFVKEPVNVWEEIKDTQGKTMLEKFYADQQKYAFSFQIMAFISRISLLKQSIRENPDSVIITERSLHTDKMVFAQMLFDSGLIEDVNFQIYLKWFDEFSRECPLNRVIYVKTDPDVCIQRIAKRSRAGESVIPIDYLRECHEYHEKMMEALSAIPQLILDGNVDIYENGDELQSWIQQISSFLQE
jgi:deoxyadenosine/deoxycytidine kinase